MRQLRVRAVLSFAATLLHPTRTVGWRFQRGCLIGRPAPRCVWRSSPTPSLSALVMLGVLLRDVRNRRSTVSDAANSSVSPLPGDQNRGETHATPEQTEGGTPRVPQQIKSTCSNYPARLAQQFGDLAIAIATVLPSKLDNIGGETLSRDLALCRAMLPERRTSATLGDMQLRSHLLNAGTATRGA